MDDNAGESCIGMGFGLSTPLPIMGPPRSSSEVSSRPSEQNSPVNRIDWYSSDASFFLHKKCGKLTSSTSDD